MHAAVRRFWKDESGSVEVADWAFVATILVLGAITGLMASRQVDSMDDLEPQPVATSPR